MEGIIKIAGIRYAGKQTAVRVKTARVSAQVNSTVIVQHLEVNQSVIPAKAGIYDENYIFSGFPIKTFGNDEFLSLVGTLPRAELLHSTDRKIPIRQVKVFLIDSNIDILYN